MAERPILTAAGGHPLERRAFLPRSPLPVLLARPAVAPRQTLVLQHGDIKSVPWKGLAPRRLTRRRLAQQVDRAADSDQSGMINVRDGAGPTARHGMLPNAMDGTMWRYEYDLLHGAHRQPDDDGHQRSR
jgi:hypothetical protein